ncbi:SPOR domain-containing protein [Devosia neptuniae]|jgi:hypothetical protein|uniref:SPOR domain-containing protein n=1 Tax=Devosia TaxID=46913 RepID=UPI0022B01773|nr:SPOR domain-containing protein [Devosia neptuniae]MCZ4346309.1 SPOR domain-containing protein [Devosia neptuniae]|tara:strand:+ start:49713 stop:51884 length:2172 start_codon:yes stop_codon:yes gene_type:complete
MAGQSEAADDLIAELAKLMAQDAQDDRQGPSSGSPAQPAPVMPVRIPGDSDPKAAAKGPAEFLRSFSATAAEPAKPRNAASGAPDQPSSPQPVATPAEPEHVPFHFDFDFRSEDMPATGVEDAPAQPAAPEQAAPAPHPDEHDSIADLISAELAADPGPAPQPQPAEPAPAVPTAAPAPSTGPALMSASVAASLGGQSRESIGAPRTDNDRFKVPPVFGLGSSAGRTAPAANPAPVAAPAPKAEPVQAHQVLPQSAEPAVVAPPAPSADDAVGLDPIDEIESLIGRAMRVEFDLPEDDAQANPAPAPEPEAIAVAPVAAPVEPAAKPARPVPSPALRSLATPTPSVDHAQDMSAADQTIFAAAQATGAKVGWVNAPENEEFEPEAYTAAPRQRAGAGISRALAGPLVAITLLLAAGFGLYWVLGLGGREEGPAPLLVADESPVKEVAPAASAEDDAGAQSIVFNEMDGVSAGADEQLVSRDQADVNEVTQVAAVPTDLSEEGLANRKVRTVKVRPDGTIVSGDDSVAGSAILPVDRPNVPAVPGAETATPELLANVEPATPTPAETAPAATVTPVEPGSTVPAVDTQGNPIAGKTAVVPRIRPPGLTLPVATQATAVQATPIAPTAEPSLSIPGATEVPALADTAPAYVQLASQRSEADARQSAQNMVTRYGPLFGGANLEVQRVDLGVKGIYYRVRVPANSIEQANMICTNVKAAGGDCFTL